MLHLALAVVVAAMMTCGASAQDLEGDFVRVDGPNEVDLVIAVPDLDGDGVEDLAVTESNTFFNEKLRLISGATGAVLTTLTLQGHDVTSMTVVDDIDGDGIPELGIGADIYEIGGMGESIAGILLSTGGIFEVYSITPPYSSEIVVAQVEDHSGDGVKDLLVTNGPFFWIYDVATKLISVSNYGGLLEDDVPKSAVEARFDVNGDGIPDVLTSDRKKFNQPQVSVVQVISGSQGMPQLAVIFPPFPGAGFGHDVAVVEDMDGDGCREILTMSRGTGDYESTGSTATIYRCNWVTGAIIDSFNVLTQTGGNLETLGDVNGDGVWDFAVGGLYLGPDSPERGGVAIYSGDDLSLISTYMGPQTYAFAESVVAVARSGQTPAQSPVYHGRWRFVPTVDGGPLPPITLLEGRPLYGDATYGAGDLLLERMPFSSDDRDGPVVISGGAPGESILVGVAEAAAMAIDAQLGVPIHIDLGQILVWDNALVFDAQGQASFPLSLVSPALAGQTVYVQAAASDGQMAVEVSNGLALRFTR